jgi:hypothetical protein
VRFAEGLLQGMSQVEAAQFAGYAGARDSVQLRSAGSSAARAKPVQALLALAESRGLGVPDAPGDQQELKRILWAHARSKDKANSIRASIELDRMIANEKAAEEIDPAEALQALFEKYPLIASVLAFEKGGQSMLKPEQKSKATAEVEKILFNWIRDCRETALRAKELADHFLKTEFGGSSGVLK